jgi:two-component system, LytTR family, response regulator
MKHIIIGLGQTRKFISIDAIMYLEGESNYAYIHCLGKKEYVAVGLKKWEERLPEKFIRIHRKYLVNLKYVETISERSVTMSDGKVFDIARRRKSVLTDAMMEHYF